VNFTYKYLYNAVEILEHAVKSYDKGLTALLPLQRKSCCGFLSPLKIYSPRPYLNQQTLGRVAITITTTPPRASNVPFCKRNIHLGVAQLFGPTSYRRIFLVNDMGSIGLDSVTHGILFLTPEILCLRRMGRLPWFYLIEFRCDFAYQCIWNILLESEAQIICI
jgi:hypothetical protein